MKSHEVQKMALDTLKSHIEATPGVAGGKPRIAGHRITVQDIVLWHERLGLSADEICAEYDLELADVYAALSYYFDHRSEIDQSIGTGRGAPEDHTLQARREAPACEPGWPRGLSSTPTTTSPRQ